MTGKIPHVRGTLAAVIGSLAALLATPAAAEPTGTFVYRITHPDHGDIGTFTNVISHRDGQTIVETRIEVSVEVLFIEVHSVEAERREVWQDGRLVGYHSVTDRNGEVISVDGRADGDSFVIDGPQGTVAAPADVHPTNPWCECITTAHLTMGSEQGELGSVTVAFNGEEAVEVEGRDFVARRFAVAGAIPAELWYERDSGVLVKFISREDGEPVAFTLTERSSFADTDVGETTVASTR